jgi:hypothetical protein
MDPIDVTVQRLLTTQAANTTSEEQQNIAVITFDAKYSELPWSSLIYSSPSSRWSIPWLALGTAYCGLAQLNHSAWFSRRKVGDNTKFHKPEDNNHHFDINDAAKFLATIECIILLYQTGMLLLRYDNQSIGPRHTTITTDKNKTSFKEYGTLSNAKYVYTYIGLFDDMCTDLRSVLLQKATHPLYRRADIMLVYVRTDIQKLQQRLQCQRNQHESISILD